MKIAVVFVPKDGQVTMFVNNTHKAPFSFILGRGLEMTVLTTLLLCSLALVTWHYLPAVRFDSAAVPPPKVPSNPYVCAVPVRPIAWPFDGSRALKVGDLVILNGTNAPTLRQIAATPHDTLSLRNGTMLEKFYAVGREGYIVVADQSYSLVRADEIRATFPSGCGLSVEDLQQFALALPAAP